jgi:hypothetical protein
MCGTITRADFIGESGSPRLPDSEKERYPRLTAGHLLEALDSLFNGRMR